MAEQPRRRNRYTFTVKPAAPDTGADVDLVQHNVPAGHSNIWTLTLPELFALQDTINLWAAERTVQAWERMRGNDNPL